MANRQRKEFSEALGKYTEVHFPGGSRKKPGGSGVWVEFGRNWLSLFCRPIHPPSRPLALILSLLPPLTIHNVAECKHMKMDLHFKDVLQILYHKFVLSKNNIMIAFLNQS
jgi:hypothetical protein